MASSSPPEILHTFWICLCGHPLYLALSYKEYLLLKIILLL